ncbi:MAG: hypothetical protein GKR89_12775 [Candidatus Latescibacteria bacterium]|nr:hypothetical protein [Candidatus Latescibacterota bacterium]
MKWRELAAAFSYALLLVVPCTAQVQTLVLGRGDLAWETVAEQVAGLERDGEAGGLRSQQLVGEQNILVGPRTAEGRLTNILGHTWFLGKLGGEGFELGVNPRFWSNSYGGSGPDELIDGDAYSVTRVVHTATGTQRGVYTFDFGLPLPVSRVRFFPPDRGIDEEGGLMKQRFPLAYEVSAALDAEDFLLLGTETHAHPLETVLGRTLANDQRVVDIRFPGQVVRFLRLAFDLIDQKYLLGEIEVFGEGFVPRAKYRSVVIPLPAAVNFGRIFWHFERFRQIPENDQIAAAPEAPVDFTLETRTGRDPNPKNFFILNDFHQPKQVDEETYQQAPTTRIFRGARPGDRAGVEDDLRNWSAWSAPYQRSGQAMGSPDGRRYLQVRFAVESDDLKAFGRIDSLAIEYSPLLVQRLIGEVGVLESGQQEVAAGVETDFVYHLRAQFGPQGRSGFDAIRLQTFAPTQFVGLEVGTSRRPVVPDSVRLEQGSMTVYFPSNKMEQVSGEQQLRLVFRTTLLNASASFLAEVFAGGGENLPQSVEAGDASEALAGDDIRIFAAAGALDVLAGLEVSSPLLTPNGDRVNDRVAVGLTLLGIEAAAMRLEVCDLSGRPLRRLADGPQGRGIYRWQWDGRDGAGALVPPGLYLLKARVDTDRRVFERVLAVAVAY